MLLILKDKKIGSHRAPFLSLNSFPKSNGMVEALPIKNEFGDPHYFLPTTQATLEF